MISIRQLKKYGWREVNPEDIGLTEEFLREFSNNPKYIEFCKRMAEARRDSHAKAHFYVLD